MDELADLGIRQAFAVVGGGSMYLSHALGISKRIKTIYCHHEQACAMAAEGYARYMCDRPALVSVTSGPGGTNTLTGIMGAYVDSIPIIVVSGQCRYNTSVPQSGLPLRIRGPQEFNIVDTVKTMTKYSKLITDPSDIVHEIRKAFTLAMSGRRGPVWLDIPLDIQNKQINVNKSNRSPLHDNTVQTSRSNINKIFETLKAAKRPCIIAGGSVRYSGNQRSFLDFLKRIKIPVLSASAHPDVLHRTHPLYFGAEGILGQRAGNFILQNADVILVLGASLSFGETGWVQENFAPNAYIIGINIDANEFRKPGLHVSSFIHCNLAHFFRLSKNYSLFAPADWFAYCKSVNSKFDPFEGRVPANNERVNTCNFWKEYDNQIAVNEVTCLGNSSCIAQWVRVGNRTNAQRTLFNTNCGSMGDDLPLAVGAASACKRAVTLVTGDGSMMMNLQELSTIRHNKLPIRIVVFSNGGYNALRQTWKRYFNGVNAGCDASSGISLPSIKKIATTFDLPYRRCRSNNELSASIAWLLKQNTAAILEIDETIENRANIPCVISRLREDGTSEPAFLQDMYPYLDRSTYDSCMPFEVKK